MNAVAEAPSFRWLFWTLALVGLAADQSSKYYLFSELYHDGRGGSIEIIPECFRLHVAPFNDVDESSLQGWRGTPRRAHVNAGALFGIGQGKNLLFGIVSIAAAAFIVGWSLRSSAGGDWFLCTALGLILAGTLGNLYDRIIFDGVRDFLHWYKGVDWPVFNIADVCLVCGAGMLLLEAFIRQPQPPQHPHAEKSEAEMTKAEVV